MVKRAAKRKKIVRVHERFRFYSFLLLLVIMTLLALFTRYQFNDILLTETYDRGREFEKNLQATFTPLLVTYNYTTIFNSVLSVASQQNVVYIAVYDKESNLAACNPFYRENHDEIQMAFPASVNQARRSRFNEGTLSLPDGRTLPVLDIVSPVYMQPSALRWGVIHVGLSLEGVYEHFGRIHLYLLISFVFSLGLIYLGLNQMSKMIQRPMDALLRGAEEIGSGNLRYHFDLPVANEFGVLAESFNQMVQRVNLLQSRLEDWNRELEARIEERTQALQQTRQFLENVFNTLTECVITINGQGYLTYANTQFYRISGFSPADLGKPFSRLFFSRGLNKYQALRCFAQARRGQSVRLEQTMIFRDTELRLDIEVTPLQSIGGVQGILVIARDVTQQKEMEHQLLQAQKMESVGTLAGGIAHDFNNILGALLPAVEMLKQKVQSQEELFRKVEIVEHSARRAAELTAQLLMFSRRREMTFHVLNLNDVVRSVAGVQEKNLPANIRLEQWLDPQAEAVNANRVVLEQMLANLIGNAAAAMSDGGRITIATGLFVPDDAFLKHHPEVLPGAYVELTVVDTGIGIAAEHLDRIYDPFFSIRRSGKASGLGLAVVYGAVKKHQGYIFCESEIGQGTRFRILLPAAVSEIVAPVVVETPLAHGKKRLIVVDDEDMVREVARDLLVELGYDVEIATSGREAVEKIRSVQEPFDLALLDMVMPEMDGLETLLAIRSLQPELKVVLISGYDTDEKIQRALGLPKVEFLQKPYKINELATLVARLMAD
jgi:two-component system cell cycle sensor histidine kinase/response regulator CckA